MVSLIKKIYILYMYVKKDTRKSKSQIGKIKMAIFDLGSKY